MSTPIVKIEISIFADKGETRVSAKVDEQTSRLRQVKDALQGAVESNISTTRSEDAPGSPGETDE